MKNRRAFLAFVIAVALMVANITAFARVSEGEQDAKGLVGAWRATFTSVDNPPSFQPIPVLLTINAEGTLVELDGAAIVPFPPPPNIPQVFSGPANGVWRKVGERKYEMKFIQIAVNPDSTLAATGTLRFTVKLNDDGDRFTGEGTFNFVAPDQTVIASGSEKISGRRIVIE